MDKEKRNLRKEMKAMKDRMSEIELDLMNLEEETSDPVYIKSIEEEYERLLGDYTELEELRKSKSNWKKYVFGGIAVITAIASCVTVVFKLSKGRKKK